MMMTTAGNEEEEADGTEEVGRQAWKEDELSWVTMKMTMTKEGTKRMRTTRRKVGMNWEDAEDGRRCCCDCWVAGHSEWMAVMMMKMKM